MTVEALFDYAEAAKADADEFDIEFDRVLGCPTQISVTRSSTPTTTSSRSRSRA